jgi:RimJ/RimL family protein N-acetyltransferase
MAIAAIPILTTPRLVLRAHERRDLDACAAMWADPAVTRYTIGAPSPRQRSWTRLLAYRGHWDLLGFGYWAVEEKASGSYVGELGFADFQRGLGPALDGIPEIGWALSPAAHGRGLATEALQAVVAWGDRALGVPRTVCLIHPDNTASLRVAAKLGYREVNRLMLGETPELVLERLANTGR